MPAVGRGGCTAEQAHLEDARPSLRPDKRLVAAVRQLIDQAGTTVIDIQISGGFDHRGLLVVCQSPDPNVIPHKGRNWRITKIAPDVFEYRE